MMMMMMMIVVAVVVVVVTVDYAYNDDYASRCFIFSIISIITTYHQ